MSRPPLPRKRLLNLATCPISVANFRTPQDPSAEMKMCAKNDTSTGLIVRLPLGWFPALTAPPQRDDAQRSGSIVKISSKTRSFLIDFFCVSFTHLSRDAESSEASRQEQICVHRAKRCDFCEVKSEGFALCAKNVESSDLGCCENVSSFVG